jgi:hypothetical protein
MEDVTDAEVVSGETTEAEIATIESEDLLSPHMLTIAGPSSEQLFIVCLKERFAGTSVAMLQSGLIRRVGARA